MAHLQLIYLLKVMIFDSYVNLPEDKANLDERQIINVDVPGGTPGDSDTGMQLLRRDTAPIFPQAAILARSAALGYGTAGQQAMAPICTPMQGSQKVITQDTLW